MHFQLGYDYVVQDVGDDLLCGDVLGLGFVGESDAVTQYVVADGPHVLRNHVTPAADEGVGPGSLGQRDRRTGRAAVSDQGLQFFEVVFGRSRVAKMMSMMYFSIFSSI